MTDSDDHRRNGYAGWSKTPEYQVVKAAQGEVEAVEVRRREAAAELADMILPHLSAISLATVTISFDEAGKRRAAELWHRAMYPKPERPKRRGK